jgi:threonine/homoserine/homoserine lactone efflux protein
MNSHTLGLFLFTCFFLSATPGPNMLSALAMGVRHGLVGAAWGGLGMCLSLGLMAALSALGLGVLLKASPLAFTIFKWVGVAYLVWLGVQSLRAPVPDADKPGDQPEDATTGRSNRPLGLLLQGGLITASNPKALIFMAAFFPQFIDMTSPLGPQLGILVGTMLVIEFGWIMTYATGGRSLARRLSGPRATLWLNRGTGLLLIAAGGLLSLASL